MEDEALYTRLRQENVHFEVPGRGRTQVESQEGPRSQRSRASCGGGGQWALKLPGWWRETGTDRLTESGAGRGQCDLGQNGAGAGGSSPRMWGRTGSAWPGGVLTSPPALPGLPLVQLPHGCLEARHTAPGRSVRLAPLGPFGFVLGEPRVGRKCRDWALVMLGLLIRNLSESLGSRRHYPHLTNKESKAPMGCNLTQ